MINIKSKGDELLETRLNEATNPLNPTLNSDAVNAFCEQVISEVEGHQIAVRLIAHKVQSPQEKESLYTFSVLDECVKKCGTRFHQEIGKFRFLNELIKIVSPKYLGRTMSPNVKQRCIECLYCLYKGLPHEKKIEEAYNMLKKQSIITKDPTYMDSQIFKVGAVPSRPHSIFDSGKDSERLSKLLKSRNPDDLREANRIIKNMVQEDNQRIEMLSKRALEMETMRNNVKLLDEMLLHYDPVETTTDDMDIMKELVENLEKSRAEMFKVSRETDDNSLLSEIIQVIDDCNSIIKKYWDIKSGSIQSNQKKTEKDICIDLLGDSSRTDDLLSKELENLGIDNVDIKSQQNHHIDETHHSKSRYDELFGIFSSTPDTTNITQPSGVIPTSSNYPIGINTLIASKIELEGSKTPNHISKSSPKKSLKTDFKGFEELDKLSQELINSAMKKEERIEKLDSLDNLDVDLLSTLDDKVKDSLNNDLPLLDAFSLIDTESDLTKSFQHIKEPPHSSSVVEVDVPKLNKESVDLNSFQISLTDIKPHPLKMPITIYHNCETKVKVILHFSSDCPRCDVFVMVAQISSENSKPVTDVDLKFAVTKPMKVRKAQCSVNRIEAHTHFTPSSPLNEIIYLYNPNKETVDMKFHFNYEIAGESFLESGSTGSITF